MNILFLTIGNTNVISTKGIYSDLINKFSKEGHSVYAVTSNAAIEQTELIEVKERNIKLLNVKTGQMTKSNMIKKGIATLLIGYQYKKAVKKYFSDIKFDLILYTTPPITLFEAVKFIKNRDGAKTYLLLKDIFPQNAVDLKIMKQNSVLHRYFRFKEKQLYRISDFIGTMSPKNSSYLLEQNPELSHSQVEECPNSLEIRPLLKEVDREKILGRYYIPTRKKIFLYGGNLGKPQGIDFLINVIKQNEYNKHSFFVVVGNGTEYGRLKELFNNNKIENTLLINHLPNEEYDELVSACDIGMIFLDYRFTIPNFPSRLLSYIEAGKAVFSATDISTDIGEIIEKEGIGIKTYSNDINSFNDKVNYLAVEADLVQMGTKAREFFEREYSIDESYNIIMSHFE